MLVDSGLKDTLTALSQFTPWARLTLKPSNFLTSCLSRVVIIGGSGSPFCYPIGGDTRKWWGWGNDFRALVKGHFGTLVSALMPRPVWWQQQDRSFLRSRHLLPHQIKNNPHPHPSQKRLKHEEPVSNWKPSSTEYLFSCCPSIVQ